MEIIIIILCAYMLLYVGFLAALIYGFTKVPLYNSSAEAPKITFSIVVPFRNEQHNLPRLLDSLAALEYPKELFEMIFVNDFSDDDSEKLIIKWRMENGLLHTTVLENLHLSGSPKKDAISRAIPIIENQWVVTTDADCIVDPKWLLTLNDYIINNSKEMVAGPVMFDGRTSFLQHFQRLDFLSLQGATMGSFGIRKAFMCNGANFAYTKKFFIALGGFSGNHAIASGDDVFLLQKAITRFPEKVGYLKSKSTIVVTQPAENWRQLFHQRVRWASKTGAYESEFGEDLALAVFLGNLAIVLAFALSCCGILPCEFLLVIFVIKLVPDVILMIQANKFFNNGKFFFPLFAAFVYPFFCVAVAAYSAVGKYEWKGR
ncbi:MAG TPA: glycosyltransferase, partial [Flavobacterium sp.]|nr:glycosyltransferase [Flavobacterium sp.]